MLVQTSQPCRGDRLELGEYVLKNAELGWRHFTSLIAEIRISESLSGSRFLVGIARWIDPGLRSLG